MLKPGESETLDLEGVKAGTYTVSCGVAGPQAGRHGRRCCTRRVRRAASAASDADLRGQNDQSDATMKAPVTAYVAQLTKGANTKGVGNQKLAPKVLADGTKEFDLTASRARTARR